MYDGILEQQKTQKENLVYKTILKKEGGNKELLKRRNPTISKIISRNMLNVRVGGRTKKFLSYFLLNLDLN